MNLHKCYRNSLILAGLIVSTAGGLANGQDLVILGDPAANTVVLAPEYPLDEGIFGGIVIGEASVSGLRTLYVATVFHGLETVSDRETVGAVFPRTTWNAFDAELDLAYPDSDLALLKVEGVSERAYRELGLQFVPLAPRPALEDQLETITHPTIDGRQMYWQKDWFPVLEGLEDVAGGTVFSLSKCAPTGTGTEVCNVVGRSGGPIFDSHGGLVGLVTGNRNDQSLAVSIQPILDALSERAEVTVLATSLAEQFSVAAVQQRHADVARLCRALGEDHASEQLFVSFERVAAGASDALMDALISCFESREFRVDFAQVTQDDSTLLIEAVCGANFKLVTFLLEKQRLDPNQISLHGSTPLGAALACALLSREERFKMVELLLKNGAVPDNPDYPSVLDVVSNNDVGPDQGELIELLVLYGADPLATAELQRLDGSSFVVKPMIELAKDSSSALSAWELFIDGFGADLNVTEDGRTPLMILAANNRDLLMGEFAEGDRRGCWDGPDHLSLKARLLLDSGRIDLALTDDDGNTVANLLEARRISSPGDRRCAECFRRALEGDTC